MNGTGGRLKLIEDEILIIFQPKNKSIKVPKGTNLIDAADKAGIIIPNICGRSGKCGKCKIKILQEKIPYTLQEEVLLTPEERSYGIHLACQVNAMTNLLVEILTEEKVTTTKFLTYDLANEFEIDNHIRKVFIRLQKPDIKEQLDDIENLKSSISLPTRQISIPLPVLQNLSSFLRKNDFGGTFVFSDNSIINIESGDTTNRLFGLAFDLGTTTIVGSLVNMFTGEILGISARTNPQTKQGADVISRVKYATSEPGGLTKLQAIVIESINEIIEELCNQAEVNFREIYELSLAGNTIMNHLFLGVTPKYIAESPYIPAFRKSQQFTAEELGITIQPRSPVSTLPNISGYVGGDITGFILASDFHKSDKIILGIDIGTNGEIVLGSKDRLLCCSAAAGPAFEGGHITNGMRAMEGAIDKFNIGDDQAFFHVIGETDPRGICGTGLIDVVAELLRVGVINITGKIETPGADSLPSWLQKRIIVGEKNNSFILVQENESNLQKQIILSQRDIRELQLGKGAIAAGIAILCKELGIAINEIDQILIAGAFGSYLNKYNAQTIGLIPAIPAERVKYVGNAASLGAKKFLLSQKIREEADQIINSADYIELSSRPDFQEIFAEKMLFEPSH